MRINADLCTYYVPRVIMILTKCNGLSSAQFSLNKNTFRVPAIRFIRGINWRIKITYAEFASVSINVDSTR